MSEAAPGQGFEAIPGFEVTEAVAAGLGQDQIQTPTAVQLAAIGPILEGRQVVVESGTGTGKTLAYLLPVLQRLRQGLATRAVCVAPTTELAMQTLRVAERYKVPECSAVALVTQGNQRQQAARLQQSTQLIVGTPERILELYASRKLKRVNTVILDEPEPILSRGDAGYLREVLSRPDPKLQLILVGATFGLQSDRFVQELMGPEVVRMKPTADPLRSQITHYSVRTSRPDEKDLALLRFIEQQRCRRAIVFVNEPHLVRHLYRYLTEHGLTTVTVSRERTKDQCRQAILDFNQGQARVLVATELMASGVDIPNVEWVLHFEMPSSSLAYVHRAGRTGRAGKTGTSVTFVSDLERSGLQRLERSLGVKFRPFPRD